ncbi:lactadherin-like [Anneissia japonica]|uniref:lactadherin-like n=1 Tax=Anneissia japonica TaxID=1529436 RepID=UPI0014254D3E|nr:lactadherin-like [Anneissia japonica]
MNDRYTCTCKYGYEGTRCESVIRTLEDNERLTALQDLKFWLALNDREHEGTFVWTTNNGSYLFNTESFDESCFDYLGVEDGTIPSERLTASSEFSPYYGAYRGRLNTAADGNLKGAWSAKSNDSDPWIQAELGSLSKVTEVMTQGREDASEWVTSYEVLYIINGEQFEKIMNANGQFECGNKVNNGGAVVIWDHYINC